ncbi:MAG: HEAT repeat domain-containing protein [Planctomycetota bacterium]
MKFAIAASISSCLVTCVLAVYVLTSGPGGRAPSGDFSAELLESIAALDARIAALEKAPGREFVARRSAASAAGDEPVSSATVEEKLAAISKRLESLTQAETIAELARSGGKKLRQRRANRILASLADEELSTEERGERLREFWETQGSVREAMEVAGLEDRDALLPLISLAQDAALDEDTRIGVLREMMGMEHQELRQPLVQMARADQEPSVRQQAIRNLAEGHPLDPDVQNAILEVSRNDPSEEVRGTASRRVLDIHEYAVREHPGTPIAQVGEEELKAARAHGWRKEIEFLDVGELKERLEQEPLPEDSESR